MRELASRGKKMYKYKTKLQELCHEKQWSKPTYKSIKYGVDRTHNIRRVKASVLVNGVFSFNTIDFCKSSKEAQNEAARIAFDYFTAPVFSDAGHSTAAGHVASSSTTAAGSSSNSIVPNNNSTTGEGILFQRNHHEMPKSSPAHSNVPASGKKTVVSKPKQLGEKASEAALRFALSIDRPYFIVQMKYYTLNTHSYLLVPGSFAKNHLRESKPMILRNVSGRKVQNVKYSYGYPGTSRLSCGWRDFAAANHLKEKDSCVFELVEENTLQMHIFRC